MRIIDASLDGTLIKEEIHFNESKSDSSQVGHNSSNYLKQEPKNKKN